jgi:hypothetical protein
MEGRVLALNHTRCYQQGLPPGGLAITLSDLSFQAFDDAHQWSAGGSGARADIAQSTLCCINRALG